jgi:1-acyl-sn-glycerol-3-phosphate acyltransferase
MAVEGPAINSAVSAVSSSPLEAAGLSGPPIESGAGGALIAARERSVCNGVSPWLAPLAMVITQDLALPGFFSQVMVRGREHLPRSGAVLLAPTHRARWDALLLPHAAGRRVTGRDCRFMVTRDEMAGPQGWLLQRLGCFPVDQGRPTLASLRLAVNLLERGEQLVMFPEGRIHRHDEPLRLHQGLARLAQLAAGQGVDVRVVPVGIAYGQPVPRPGQTAALQIGPALGVSQGGRAAAASFTADLAASMVWAEREARKLVGRPLGGFGASP